MNRRQYRENTMITLYQYAILPRDIDVLIEDQFNMPKDEIDPYFYDVLTNAIEHYEDYKESIEKVLSGWSFDRLGVVEQNLLILACSEMALKQTEKAVIIDESIRLSKKYCDEEAYKIINKVLDTVEI